MQRSTLASILERLPLLLRNRYTGSADRFWVNHYNNLMGELERTGCGPHNTVMVPVPWQTIQSGEVVKPALLSDIVNVFSSISGPIAWESDGDGAHLLWTPPAASQIVDGVSGFNRKSPYIGRDFLTLGGDGLAGVAVGDAIVVHTEPDSFIADPGSYNPTTYPIASWVISHLLTVNPFGDSGVAVAIPMQSGEYDVPIATSTDYYWVLRDFLIVEGHRAYHRISTTADLTSLSPEWDDLVEAYLRFRGEVQTDQSSKDSADWGGLWQARKKQWMAAHSRQPHAAKKPSLFPSMNMNTRR